MNLAVDVELPQDVHVYAPGVKGYKPIQLELRPSNEFELTPPTYPPSRALYLQAIREEVPAFEAKFRITSDVKISANSDFIKSLGATGRTITINGQLNSLRQDDLLSAPFFARELAGCGAAAGSSAVARRDST